MLVALALATASLLAKNPPGTDFIRGGDISFIPQIEAQGTEYFDGGARADPILIFKKHGWNAARLRVWVNPPAPGWCDQAHTFAMAKRIVSAGLKLIIDFHYSDSWADPGKQYTPAAWTRLNHAQLVEQVQSYTENFIRGLIAQGTTPYAVDIGNEVTHGMLWPDGYLNGSAAQWQKFTDLLKAGVVGVRGAPAGSSIKIVIHIDRGGDNAGARSFMDHLKAYGVSFDVLGLSYYYWWHGSAEAMNANIDDLGRRYGKDIWLAETGEPWTLRLPHDTGQFVKTSSQFESSLFAATPEGQASFLVTLLSCVQNIPFGRGRGVLYWAPEWTDGAKRRSPWDNLAVFDYDHNALPALSALGGEFKVAPNKQTVHGGVSASVTLKLAGPPMLTSSTLLLYSWNQAVVSPPASVEVSKGGSTTKATIRTYPVKKTTLVWMAAYWAGHSVLFSVTVTP